MVTTGVVLVLSAIAHSKPLFQSTPLRQKHPYKGVISWHTTRVICSIFCPCGKYYIGKTTHSLKVHKAEHRSSVRCKNLIYPVAAHFAEAAHSTSSLRYIGIEKVAHLRRGGDFNKLLLKREAFWIYSLNTLAPNGLKIDFDLRHFL